MNLVTEGSFTEKDVPNKFYCIIKFDPTDTTKMYELSDRQLVGVQGISQAKIIVPTFLGDGRDAMLVMRGEEIVKLNKVSRVMYSNPDYLIANNFAVTKRLASVDTTYNGATSFYQNFFRQLTNKFRIEARMNELFHSLAKINTGFSYFSKALDSGKVKINSVNQFSFWLKSGMLSTASKSLTDQDKIDIKQIPVEEISSIVREVLLDFVKIFEPEGEWVLKNKILTVPPKSDLFILIPPVPKTIFQAWKTHTFPSNDSTYELEIEELQTILRAIKEYRLSEIYNVRLMNKDKFMEAKGRILQTQGMNNFLSSMG